MCERVGKPTRSCLAKVSCSSLQEFGTKVSNLRKEPRLREIYALMEKQTVGR